MTDRPNPFAALGNRRRALVALALAIVGFAAVGTIYFGNLSGERLKWVAIAGIVGGLITIGLLAYRIRQNAVRGHIQTPPWLSLGLRGLLAMLIGAGAVFLLLTLMSSPR